MNCGKYAARSYYDDLFEWVNSSEFKAIVLHLQLTFNLLGGREILNQNFFGNKCSMPRVNFLKIISDRRKRFAQIVDKTC